MTLVNVALQLQSRAKFYLQFKIRLEYLTKHFI